MNTNCQTITESVYMRKRSQVLSIFLKAGIDMQKSEDLTQEVFLRMMGVDVLNHDTADAMVIKIAYNLKTDYIRKKRLPRVSLSDIFDVEDGNNTPLTDMYVMDIVRCEDDAVKKAPTDFARKNYDDSSWGYIKVPSNWEMEGHGHPVFINIKYNWTPNPPYIDIPNPTGIYRTMFRVPADWKGNALMLHFGSIAGYARVFVNGAEVGMTKASKAPAEFDITRHVTTGDNLLAVQVLKYHDGSYMEDQDFWRMAGIERDVYVQAYKPLSVWDYEVKAMPVNKYRDGKLTVSVKLRSFIMCEYAHAQGNSNGNFKDLWDLIKSAPNMQGGFIWDFQDQGLKCQRNENDDHRTYYMYNGGMGSYVWPDDENSGTDGIIASDGTEKPQAFATPSTAWAARLQREHSLLPQLRRTAASSSFSFLLLPMERQHLRFMPC